MSYTSRRSILTGTAAAIAAGSAINFTAIGAAKAAPSDAIFAAIDKHGRMVIAINNGELGASSDDELNEVCAEAEELHEGLAKACPATLAGAVGLLRYMTYVECGEGVSDVPEYFQTFLDHIACEFERMGVA
jgi:hypothetical protein